jgi:hypothetical protein
MDNTSNPSINGQEFNHHHLACVRDLILECTLYFTPMLFSDDSPTLQGMFDHVIPYNTQTTALPLNRYFKPG